MFMLDLLYEFCVDTKYSIITGVKQQYIELNLKIKFPPHMNYE